MFNKIKVQMNNRSYKSDQIRTPINILIVGLFLLLTIRGSAIWSDDFTDKCPQHFYQELDVLDGWIIFMHDLSRGDGDEFTYQQFDGLFIGCFMTDYHLYDVLPPSLTFIELYGSCIRKDQTQLTSGRYKLSFNFYRDPQSQTDPQTLRIYIIDKSTNLPITSDGGETIMTLRDSIYLKKQINFEISSNKDIYVVFCEDLLNDISGVTNVQLASRPPVLTCDSGEEQKDDNNGDPICVQTQTITDSIDCFLFTSSTECGACDQLTEDTDLVDLDTLAKGCIARSDTNYDSYCSLYSYSSNFKCEICTYATGQQFSSLKVLINNVPIYKCPDPPSYRQEFCTEYVQVGQYLSCMTCPYTLMPGANLIQVCIRDIIPQCKFYKPDASCDPCASGIPSTGIICPTTAVSYFPYCLKATKIGAGYMCIVCFSGYVLNFKNQCLKMVKFCSNYRLNICTSCIQNYVMSEGNCYEPITKCKTYQLNGRCKNCLDGFSVQKNGTCVPQILIQCTQNQYLSGGRCVDGNVTFCTKYQSGSGNCLECREGYKVTAQKKCQIICPKNTQFQKWMLKNGLCFWEDLRCKNAHSNGYCYECKDEFYAFNGKCYRISNNL